MKNFWVIVWASGYAQSVPGNVLRDVNQSEVNHHQERWLVMSAVQALWEGSQ